MCKGRKEKRKICLKESESERDKTLIRRRIRRANRKEEEDNGNRKRD